MGPLTDREIEEIEKANWSGFHDPLCPESIGDGDCSCKVSLLLRAVKRIRAEQLRPARNSADNPATSNSPKE